MTSDQYRQIVIAIYIKYNPAKLDSVEQLLTKYWGNEDELINSIAKKYSISTTEKEAFLNSVRIDTANTKKVNNDRKPFYAIAVTATTVTIVAIGLYYNKNGNNNPITVQSSTITDIPKISTNNTIATYTDRNQERQPPNSEMESNGEFEVIVPKAFFYAKPDYTSKEEQYVLKTWIVVKVREDGAFYFVQSTNKDGTIKEGWMPKQELSPYVED